MSDRKKYRCFLDTQFWYLGNNSLTQQSGRSSIGCDVTAKKKTGGIERLSSFGRSRGLPTEKYPFDSERNGYEEVSPGRSVTFSSSCVFCLFLLFRGTPKYCGGKGEEEEETVRFSYFYIFHLLMWNRLLPRLTCWSAGLSLFLFQRKCPCAYACACCRRATPIVGHRGAVTRRWGSASFSRQIETVVFSSYETFNMLFSSFSTTPFLLFVFFSTLFRNLIRQKKNCAIP